MMIMRVVCVIREYFVRLGVMGGLMGGLLGGLLGGCTAQPEVTDNAGDAGSETIARQQVVATTALLCDLTTEIAGEAIDLTCLMSSGQDPHTYRLKPSDRAAIEAADLVFHNGYDLMPGLAELVKSSDSGKEAGSTVVAVAEQAVPEPILFEGHDHDHDHDHDQDQDETVAESEEAQGEGEPEEGHDHTHDEAEHPGAGDPPHDEQHDEAEHHGATQDALVPDPHVWHDARNGKAMVSVIADQLIALDPDRAEEYSSNATALHDRLDMLHVWIGEQIATIPENDRQLVTTHDAFGYFAAAYGVTQNSALSGLSPQEKPSPATLAAIVETIKADDIPVIFAENTSGLTLIEAVANEAGITVAAQPLLVDSPDPAIADAADYPAMLAYNTCVIVTGLGGQCDREALGF